MFSALCLCSVKFPSVLSQLAFAILPSDMNLCQNDIQNCHKVHPSIHPYINQKMRKLKRLRQPAGGDF